MARFALPLFVLSVSAVGLHASSADDCFRAIRGNDLAALKSSIAAGAVNLADGRGTTPLHYAAAYGSVEAVRLLLDSGADVGARNAMDATPLILAASSPEKVKLLLAKGADVKAKSKAGRTALHIAAGRFGSNESARALLDAGADVHAVDERGQTALALAAMYADLPTVELLLERGALPDAPDKGGFTALINASTTGELARVRLLLAKGANVNAANTFTERVRHGPIALTGLTPLMLAASYATVDMVRTLIEAGAKVNVQDGRGMTPLMAAVSSENQDPQVIRALLKAGADPNAKDPKGETVLDWARKFAHPGTLRLLESAGAKGGTLPHAPKRAEAPAEVGEAVELAASLLRRSSAEFFKQSGCLGCHHQGVAARADAVLSRVGFEVPASAREVHTRTMAALRPAEPALLQFLDPGGEVDSVGTALVSFAAAGIPANSLTDAGVSYIAGRQHTDGSWKFQGISRVPLEDSNITRTGIALKALQAYSWPARQAEFSERVARARAWLLKAEPRNSFERADLLLGLHWAGASAADLSRVAARLRRDQRPDGGWAQNRYLASDAYATGLAMHALHESGQLRASDPAYRRGVEFLLKSQLEDGSWYVRSRAPKFQPYFQSGFPHEHDQWISAGATAYAVMALGPAARQPRMAKIAAAASQ